MEYLENGSLDRFIERSRDRSSRGLNPVPNRVLWFIFMCCTLLESTKNRYKKGLLTDALVLVARMVVAMSRPASGSTAYRSNAQTALEEPRIFDTMNGQQIYHGDLVNTKNCKL
jgi:hypothetical protein